MGLCRVRMPTSIAFSRPIGTPNDWVDARALPRPQVSQDDLCRVRGNIRADLCYRSRRNAKAIRSYSGGNWAAHGLVVHTLQPVLKNWTKLLQAGSRVI